MALEEQLSQPMEPVIVQLSTVETIVLPEIAVDKECYYVIDSCTISNVASWASKFTIYMYLTGGAASADNALCVDVAIPGNTIYQLPLGPFIVYMGYKLTGKAQNNHTINVILMGRVAMMPDPKFRL